MRLESSISISNQDGDAVGGICSAVHNHQVHLSVFVPVDCSQSNRRRPGSKFHMWPKSAVAIVDEDRNRIGILIDGGDVRNVVAIKVGHDKLGWSRSD